MSGSVRQANGDKSTASSNTAIRFEHFQRLTNAPNKKAELCMLGKPRCVLFFLITTAYRIIIINQIKYY